MAKRRPVIGIPCGSTGSAEMTRYSQKRTYVRAVAEAGGVPLLIPPQSSIDEVLELLDGILLAGGGDVDPSAYGDENRGSEEMDLARDQLELALAKRAAVRGKPIFGICRGQQVINVAFDGGLIQHVDTHRQDAGRDTVTHQVEVVPGSRLAGVIGSLVEVNTFHHQVVDPERIGRGLRVTAFSTDGQRFIEALESDDGRILTVQWHPEDLTSRVEARALFRWLVEAAAEGIAEPTSPAG